MKQSSRILILILFIALVIRITWAMHASSSLDQLPDQHEYLSLGQNLLHQGSLKFFDLRFHQTIRAYRMPGYPAFIAICGGSIRMIRVAQDLVDLSTIFAVFLLARQLTPNPSTAVVAAGLMALNPFYTYFTITILSETLFAALLAWTLWSLLTGHWIVAIILNVVFCYVRPSGLLLTPLLILVINLNQPGQFAYPVWKVIRQCGIFVLFLSVCLFPWALRNHSMLGSWIWTTTNGGITAYDGFHPGAQGGSDQRFVTDFPQLSSMNEVERSRFFTHEAMDWAGHNWAQLPALATRKILRGWSPIPLSQEFGKPLYRIASAMYAVPFDLLCVAGLFSPRLTRGAKVLLITPAVYFTLVQVMSVGSIRYRMPAEAPLAVVAGVGAVDLVKRKKAE